jgi:hypothetical protein
MDESFQSTFDIDLSDVRRVVRYAIDFCRREKRVRSEYATGEISQTSITCAPAQDRFLAACKRA